MRKLVRCRIRLAAGACLLVGASAFASRAAAQDFGFQGENRIVPGIGNRGVTGATFGILVQGTIGCVHTQPGVQSELRGFLRFTAVAPAADFGGSGGLLDVAMIDEGTDEGADSMLPPDLDGGGHGPAGAPFPSTFTVEGGGPGLIQNIFSGTVGENGVGTFVLPIRALGAYRVALTGLNDIAITDIPNLSADGFPLTFNVGATCTPPANFP